MTEVQFVEYTFTGLPVEQRGHEHLWRYAETRTLDASMLVLEGEPVTENTHVNVWNGSYSCRWCDAYPSWSYDGEKLTAKTECPFPQGVKTTFTLTVTSGRIIVDDTLDNVFDVPLPNKPGYNSVAGQSLYCRLMAEAGCAYGPVGNTSPDLVRTGPDTYVIVSHDDEAPNGDPTRFEGEVLATICTDLHAYSIADFDAWVAQGGDPDNLPALSTVIEVPNGVYEFEHHTTRADFDDETLPTVFASIKRRP